MRKDPSTNPLKEGDIIVHVRKHYQNHDHTFIPIEPKIYIFNRSRGSGVSLKNLVKPAFLMDGVQCVSSQGWDTGLFYMSCVTLEDYISGNYNKDIILDEDKWNSLEDFLLFKMENDHKITLEKEAARWK